MCEMCRDTSHRCQPFAPLLFGDIGGGDDPFGLVSLDGTQFYQQNCLTVFNLLNLLLHIDKRDEFLIVSRSAVLKKYGLSLFVDDPHRVGLGLDQLAHQLLKSMDTFLQQFILFLQIVGAFDDRFE